MKIAIAGYGIEGKASYRYFASRGDVTIVDEHDEVADLPHGVPTLLGKGAFSRLQGFDMVIRTASLPPSRIKTNGKVWSATNEFFAHCTAPIIGVTGTKGKGTTSSLIASILRVSGKTVHLVGNIGIAALDVLGHIEADDIVVFEMSSFQLWDIEKSPHIAVVLKIEPDHLNVHADFADYVAAKARIARYQTKDDIVVYFAHDEQSKNIAQQSAGHKLSYEVKSGDNIVIDNQVICAKKDVGLLGEHNIENIYAALTAAWQYAQDTEAARRAIENFTSLPHRIELVRTLNEIKFYDDSYSSAPTATKVAISAFKSPVILIAGGFDKGIDYKDMSKVIVSQPNVKKVLLIGQTKQKIAAYLPSEMFELGVGFSDTVRRAYELAVPGDIVLLSPGCASFDMFKNFTERGELFQQEVKKL